MTSTTGMPSLKVVAGFEVEGWVKGQSFVPCEIGMVNLYTNTSDIASLYNVGRSSLGERSFKRQVLQLFQGLIGELWMDENACIAVNSRWAVSMLEDITFPKGVNLMYVATSHDEMSLAGDVVPMCVPQRPCDTVKEIFQVAELGEVMECQPQCIDRE